MPVVAFPGATVLGKLRRDNFYGGPGGVLLPARIGVLLTAILMAGRTASAFTAQIGSMKANEEIDAIRTWASIRSELLVCRAYWRCWSRCRC